MRLLFNHDRAGAAQAAAQEAVDMSPALSKQPHPHPPSGAQPVYLLRNGAVDHLHRVMLKGLTLPELEEWCARMGEPARRAKQLAKALYGQGRWVRDLAELDGDSALAFSNAFKAKVAAHANLSGGLRLRSTHTARDGTHKLVFDLVAEEGSARGSVETVLIPMTNRQGQGLRFTACVSTQVGCAMNCQFCLTGRMGLLGNLSTAQVLEQVVVARRWLWERHQAEQKRQELVGACQQVYDEAKDAGEIEEEEDEDGNPPGALSLLVAVPTAPTAATMAGVVRRRPRSRPTPISNCVLMGMGEPLHNYDVTLAACDLLAEALEISRSKIIVSTVGLANAMRSFLATRKAKLALSLHATTDTVRDWIVPTNRRHPIAELVQVLEEYFPLDKKGPRGDDFVVIEYLLLKGVNDTVEDAQRLVQLTEHIYCMVNLIVFNPHNGTLFERSSAVAIRAFRGVLLAAGRVCTVRVSKGDDEMAACGQLGDVALAKRPVPVNAPPAALRDLLGGAEALRRQQQQHAGVDIQV